MDPVELEVPEDKMEAYKKIVYPPLRKVIQRVLENDETDDTLLDYLMLLLQNKRSKQHLLEEVDSFVPGQANSIVEPFWKAVANAIAKEAKQEKKSTPPETAKSVPEELRTSRNLTKRSAESSSAKEPSSKENANESRKRQRTAAVAAKKIYKSPKEDASLSFTITVNDRSKPEPKDTKSNAMVFTVKNETAEKRIAAAASMAKKTRCSFWPQCGKADACPFHHPSEPCRFYPKCTFGKSCLYIHPQDHDESAAKSSTEQPASSASASASAEPTAIPCRYGIGCFRADCKFSHPPGRRIDSTVSPSMNAKNDRLCMYDPKCTKIVCPFQHPKRDNDPFFSQAS